MRWRKCAPIIAPWARDRTPACGTRPATEPFKGQLVTEQKNFPGEERRRNPVLATDVGGNPELVEPGVTGTLVPRNDAESMAHAMRAYADSTELCRRHGAEARRTVERRFGMEAMVNAYMAVYDQLLAGNRGERSCAA